MWSLLSTLLVAPALVMIFDTSLVRPAEEPRRETSRSASDRRPPASQQSFVENAAGAAYPIPEELGEQQRASEEPRSDREGPHTG